VLKSFIDAPFVRLGSWAEVKWERLAKGDYSFASYDGF
jgi:hypothetical protein